MKLTEYITKPEGRHRLGVLLVALLYLAIIVSAAVHGFQYYRLPLEQRPFHPLNRELRPSGAVGLRMAFLGVASFCGIYLYSVRKHWKWLGRIGRTRHWLDIHVVMGTAAPILITFHSAFKTRGLAGTAYWIMIVVALSGFVGRYLYAQVPRRINAAELSLQEMQTIAAQLTEQLQAQSLFTPEELKPLFAVPPKQQVERMSVPAAFLLMISCDLKRPFQMARLRRRTVKGMQLVTTFGGLLPSNQANLERVIELMRRRAWMATKISFLAKTQHVFHLWHVIHRPFSYSFAVLVCVHVGFVWFIGYY